MTRILTGRTGVVLLCLMWLCAAARPASQVRPGLPATQGPGKTVTGGIRGCVVAADTGTPVRQASVQVIASSVGVIRSTATDSTGCYALSNLPDAGYVVQVSKEAYATLRYGEDAVSGVEGETVRVSDGKTVADINVRLPKAGVITGQVLDGAGEPVPNVLVQAVSVVSVGPDEDPAVFPHAPSARRTNDLGRYRLFGLPTGDYAVFASVGAPAGKVSAELTAFIPTYFPAAPALAGATVLSVNPGQEFSGVDIVLAAAPRKGAI